MCVLRHSLDIFKNCFINIDTLDFGKSFTDSDLQEILAYLNILDSVCPSRITLELHHSIHQTPVHLRYQICQVKKTKKIFLVLLPNHISSVNSPFKCPSTRSNYKT
ncbi:unnamed protein product [Meloidogyne enterolobii]|uniref:Uncharacterized protein n=1 Tax=Meloidogyne enterolobii TaxID=390850 RepID=A0ACB0YV14_MELEN